MSASDALGFHPQSALGVCLLDIYGYLSLEAAMNGDKVERRTH